MHSKKVKIQFSDPTGSTPNIKNITYFLQMSENINKVKQMVAINTIRNHSVEGFCSSFPV